ncbi:MAG: ATP-binding cassette domain-containing protein [Fibrobacter sp.]|nr:ATP-binding cassette domain-containing protein [Fibrobacter sp.]
MRAGYGTLEVLSDISFDLAPGSIRIILGTSGCGKSTLLNNILGLEVAWGGTLDLLGHHLRAGVDPIPLEVRQQCGVLFQNGALLSSITVAENVALPLRMHHPEIKEDILREMVAQKLESVSMLHAWHRLPGELSGGMRKRAALARAMILDPQILFCDEPSAGLDPVTSNELDKLLLKLRSELGITMLVVTHELNSIDTIADDVLFLSQAKVLFDGSLNAAKNSSEAEVANFFRGFSSDEFSATNAVSFDIKEEL